MLKRKAVFLIMSMFSLFPLMPNRIKGLPVILLFLISTLLYFSFKKRSINLKKVVFFSSPFILILLSLFYTTNFVGTDKILSTRLPLLVLPVSFSLLASSEINFSKKQLVFFYQLFFVTTTIFCLLIFSKILNLDYYSNNLDISEIYFNLMTDMYGIHQHPIYASIFISIAFCFGLREIETQKNKIKLFFIIIGMLFISYILFFLSRKGVIIALFFGLVVTFGFRLRKIKSRKIILLFVMFLIAIISFSPILKKRFNEIFSQTTYKEVNINNSSSIRYGVYSCTLEVMSNSLLFGYGIGDVKDELQKSYLTKSNVLVEGDFNSHNQYFSYILSNGIFGVFFLILILLRSFKLGFKTKNTVFMFIITFYSIALLFENILERQSGVILFMFLLSFFNFINYSKSEIKNSN